MSSPSTISDDGIGPPDRSARQRTNGRLRPRSRFVYGIGGMPPMESGGLHSVAGVFAVSNESEESRLYQGRDRVKIRGEESDHSATAIPSPVPYSGRASN